MNRILIITLIVFTGFLSLMIFRNSNDTKKTIETYILENPEIIIKSLENYSEKEKKRNAEISKSMLDDFFKNKSYKEYPYIGNDNTDNILVEFIDYNCGYCKKTLATITKLLEEIKNIRVVFVDYPILTETSELGAKAVLAANIQNQYFNFHSKLLNHSSLISENYIMEIAKELNLDLKKFQEDMNSNSVKKAIENNINFAKNLKIRGTPTFIIGDKILPGAYEYNKLKNIILGEM